MKKIIDSVDHKVLEKTVQQCREKGIVIPTFEEMRNPEKIPQHIKERVKKVGLWDIDPVNLFRITWRNNMETGLYGDVNILELPSSLTGTKARIVGIVGKYFPTGAHKVGAAFGCLVPRLVAGKFDPTTQKAVWPSTGNYCRGGAFDSVILGCTPVAILPEDMSKERFEWLHKIGAEVIATPGCESNVKEIYDECWNIKKNRKDCVIFNQFEEFGNPMWHYAVTGHAISDAFEKIKSPQSRLAGWVSATGSAGTIGAGEYLKRKYPNSRIVASEALQCPTIYQNGFGGHRIEGIGDKHIPWVHNVRNTDMVTAIDDEDCMNILRLFNEPEGKKVLREKGVPESVVSRLDLLGISGISNMLSAIKMAKYYECDENDIIFTVFTDSAEMYKSRVTELAQAHGSYSPINAHVHFEGALHGQTTEHAKELNYRDRKAVHNLKYFTWVEQQGRTAEDLNELWHPETWDAIFEQIPEWDNLIREFNKMTGLAK
jgi:cysteine synthase A